MPTFLSFVTDFGDTAVTVPLAALMALFLVAAGQRRLALGWTLAILGCAAAIGTAKLALSACGHPFGSALASPSGHSAMSAAVYGGYAAVIGASLAPPLRAAAIAAAAALAAGIALSRAWLHYHSPIEVVAGVVIGGVAVAVIFRIVARLRPARLPVGWLAAAALGLVLLRHGQRWPAEETIRRLAAWFDRLRSWCG